MNVAVLWLPSSARPCSQTVELSPLRGEGKQEEGPELGMGALGREALSHWGLGISCVVICVQVPLYFCAVCGTTDEGFLLT